MAVLSVNAGSSSLKFALYPLDTKVLGLPLLVGQFERLEAFDASISVSTTKPTQSRVASLKYNFLGKSQMTLEIPLSLNEDPFDAAIKRLKILIDECLSQSGGSNRSLSAIAHRVVHGGSLYKASIIVTRDVLTQLASLNSLAPLHQPHNLAGIESFIRSFPSTIQVACFDTSFHTSLSDLETNFAIEKKLTDSGIKRYGFHGLSYQYISQQLADLTQRSQGKAILAHLGNGASLCATREHKSVATTMGFSALDGLMMGTRSGSIDPGVLLYLLGEGWSAKEIETSLYKKSGLFGVSGLSADVRTLRESKEERAVFALELFTHRIIKEMGALTAVLGGVDLICFSGGIGEHDSVLRAAVCKHLAWLGIDLDNKLNQSANVDRSMMISHKESRVQVWVVPTDEGRVAAQEAVRLTQSPR